MNLPRHASNEDPWAPALAYLSSFTDYEQKAADRLSRVSLDLDRMRRLADAFDRPELAAPVIHVAGSKGKGSTALFCDSLLRAHGLTTGRFLSPHLSHVGERIAVNGTSATPSEFDELVDRLRSVVSRLQDEAPDDVPSFFESVALMAFLRFREARVDAAVVEVGLGGRLDATNIVEPAVTVITTIDLEHTRVLGPTRREIAIEKAGIVKSGRPLVCGVPRDSEEGRAIAAVAAEREAPVWWLGEDIAVRDVTQDRGGQGFAVSFGDRSFDGLRTRALGRHQLDNAALAVAACHLLAVSDRVPVLSGLAETAVRIGLDVTLPGRLEVWPAGSTTPPLPWPLLLDSAHTPGSMAGLAATIPLVFGGRKPDLLVAMLRDKDVAACLAPLDGVIARIWVTTAPSPRSRDPEDLAREIAGHLPHIPCGVFADRESGGLGVPVADDAAGLVIAGSSYLAGDLRGRLRP